MNTEHDETAQPDQTPQPVETPVETATTSTEAPRSRFRGRRALAAFLAVGTLAGGGIGFGAGYAVAQAGQPDDTAQTRDWGDRGTPPQMPDGQMPGQGQMPGDGTMPDQGQAPDLDGDGQPDSGTDQGTGSGTDQGNGSGSDASADSGTTTQSNA